MNGIIYARVSTEEQSKSGLSLEYQKESCKDFCVKNEIHIKDENIFLETYSGAFLERPKLSKIFEIIRKQNIDCIVVLRRDRFARDMLVFQEIQKNLGEAGVKIFYAEEMLTGDEGIDAFMGNALISFAEYEKGQIFKRTYSGRRQASKIGIWTTQVPYGYIKNSEKKLELYKPEVKIIELIIKLYLDENMKLGEIVGYLNDKNILPPSMSEKQSNTQKGSQKLRKNAVGFWGISAVSRILENAGKYYTGEYRAFTTQYKKIGDTSIIVGERDEEDIITIKIPKICDTSIAQKIADKKTTNRAHATKSSFRTYLLKGKLFCDCQSDLRSFKGYFNSAKELRNYRCTMSDKRKASEDRRCNNNISGLKIDKLAIEPDHVHMLIQVKPDKSISDVLKVLKGGTSRILRKEYKELEEFLWGDSFWADGYFAESVGEHHEKYVREYIAKQGQ